jgi:D-3-phosphoglycerate dehydrogenase
MNRPKVVVPDDAPPVLAPSRAYPELLERADVEYYDSLPGSEETLAQRIGDANVVVNVRSSSRLSEQVLSRCPNLRLVSIWGTGTDNVDLGAAARLGIAVTNTPGVSAVSIAEHTLALALAVARRIPRVDAATRGGQWLRAESVQLHGKTVGVIGLGAIGRKFAQLARAIGMRVLAWTFHPDASLGFEIVTLEQLITQSDVVSLHLRLSEKTRAFLGAREFGLMKPSAIFINTARGPIVDEPALVEALESGRIAGAGLDVFEIEPLPAGHPLTRLSNVVLTPHSAGVTPEVLEAGLAMSVSNIWAFLSGRPENLVPP